MEGLVFVHQFMGGRYQAFEDLSEDVLENESKREHIFELLRI